MTTPDSLDVSPPRVGATSFLAKVLGLLLVGALIVLGVLAAERYRPDYASLAPDIEQELDRMYVEDVTVTYQQGRAGGFFIFVDGEETNCDVFNMGEMLDDPALRADVRCPQGVPWPFTTDPLARTTS